MNRLKLSEKLLELPTLLQSKCTRRNNVSCEADYTHALTKQPEFFAEKINTFSSVDSLLSQKLAYGWRVFEDDHLVTVAIKYGSLLALRGYVDLPYLSTAAVSQYKGRTTPIKFELQALDSQGCSGGKNAIPNRISLPDVSVHGWKTTTAVTKLNTPVTA
ncbi:hypothetical protein DKK73_05345 [Bifidobacterium asteroides]|nr:hypothetical protein DKK73_05345 [Bifidobacterium asteroides]